jgi:hypothetical protein
VNNDNLFLTHLKSNEIINRKNKFILGVDIEQFLIGINDAYIYPININDGTNKVHT